MRCTNNEMLSDQQQWHTDHVADMVMNIHEIDLLQ